ncbi:MAG: hypothetical protein AB7T18_17140 [Alphaproteobacteria bacterium]
MSSKEPDQELDPDAAQIVKRVRRLMLITGATTLVAMAAVFGVIGYRVFKSGESPAAGTAPALETAVLPKGARVIATGVSDGRIAVTIEIGGAVEIRTFDLKTLKPAGQLRLRAEP